MYKTQMREYCLRNKLREENQNFEPEPTKYFK